MKTSLKKLQKFAALRHDKRAHKQHQALAHDELARATEAMNDMKDCYDRLLSAAAATANSAYEFSESLREMGDCLLEKTALNDDEESGKVLLMLGKVQFQLQKLVDSYRSHIFKTITIPSESLLNELRIVEEMKKRCDGKREIYEDLMKKQKEKGRLRNGKGECFPSHHLKEAHDEYDEEANVFVFRMKSLKQGQSRSLLTQASRHHAAQLCFFKKALRSLEAIEPHVRLVAVKQHIDYQFTGLKEDGREICGDDDDDDESDSGGDDDTEDGSETNDAGELSFDYGKNGPVVEVPVLKSSMELDNADVTFSTDLKSGAAKEKLQSPGRNSFAFQREVRGIISKSAPLFPEKKSSSSDMMRPSPSRKFTSYVLPTPNETKSPTSTSTKLSDTTNEVPQTRQAAMNLWHSSPIDPNKYRNLQANENKLSIKATQLPSPSPESLSFKHLDPSVASQAKKPRRQAFSGPLTKKPWPSNSNFSSSGPIISSAASYLRNPLPRPKSTPRLSSSPPFVSSPKISELHELPRPPLPASGRPSIRGTHSGPLMKSHELSSTAFFGAASRLPMPPPQALSRSYSIPVGGGPVMQVTLHVPLEASSQQSRMVVEDDVSSPPLTPISLANVRPSSPPS